jgi:alpha(1,3/1,4) fucosyltransferase
MEKIKIGVWNFYEILNFDNFLFKSKNASIGDDLLLPFNFLYEFGANNNVSFNTLPMCEIETQDAFLFIDFPDMKSPLVQEAFLTSKPKYLIIFESELIRKENFDSDNHVLFDKVFTWSDVLIKNNQDKYKKLNFSYDLPRQIARTKKSKLCTLIAGNKKLNHPLELYSKRVEVIRWFEVNHIEDFDFYGTGWDCYYFTGPRFVRALNRIKPVARLFASKFPSYKGKIASKKEILQKYKFSICFENARDIPGYITEKIFDCFFSGCVPIYWGANNIEEHIPKNCFIDFTRFSSLEEVYQYITNMPDDVYQKYLDDINDFLNGEDCYSYSIEFFSKKIVSVISEELAIEK